MLQNLGPEITTLSRKKRRYLKGAYLELDVIDVGVTPTRWTNLAGLRLGHPDAFQDSYVPQQTCYVLKQVIESMLAESRGH
jgi:hypothetical protein